MKKIIICVFLVSLLIMIVSCQIGSENSSKNINKTEKLLEILNKAKTEFNIPALGAIILNSDSIIDKAIIGVRSIEDDQEATFDDSFHLGSNTKAITGFIAGKLVEDRKISWDTRFFDLFPELKDISKEEYHLISLSDLLSHRAKVLQFKTVDNDILNRIPASESDIKARRLKFCEYVLQEELERPFFKTYSYSNAGYVLATAMLEESAGISWEELVQEIMVDDLELFANVGWPIEIDENQPRGHLPGSYIGEETEDLIIFDKDYHNENEDILSPAGDLNINMLDYAKYIQLNLQGLKGVDNYLSSDTYEFIHFGIPNYSIGWENSKKGGLNISEHSGSKGNFFCHTYIVKEKDIAIIVFANSGILNALNPIEYYQGGKKLDSYLHQIENLY
jgi:D-alanyl-D-alanine carboxypeptidase